MRKVQGLHAPLKMMYEKKACPKSDTFLASPTGAIFNLTSSKVTMKWSASTMCWEDLKITEEWLILMT